MMNIERTLILVIRWSGSDLIG